MVTRSPEGQTVLDFDQPATSPGLENQAETSQEPRQEKTINLLEISEDDRKLLFAKASEHYKNPGICPSCNVLQEFSTEKTCDECEHHNIRGVDERDFSDKERFAVIADTNRELLSSLYEEIGEPEGFTYRA